MAKLTGVTTIDMQDGDITKVSYQGEEYTKVGDFDGATEVGNLIRCTYTFGRHFTEGAYYEVIKAGGKPARDNDGDNPRLRDSKFDVFRKSPVAVSPPFAEMITSKIDSVEERVSALEDAKNPTPTFNEGDRVKALRGGEFGDLIAGGYGTISRFLDDETWGILVVTDDVTDYFRPQDLELATEVEALKVGDYAVIIQSAYHLIRYKVGDIVPVVEISSDGFPIVLAKGHARERMNPVQVRKATQAEIGEATKPVVGDIVVITGNTNGSRNKVGDIGKVVVAAYNDSSSLSVDVPGNTDERYLRNYTKFTEMRPATPAEIEDYEFHVIAVEREAEDAEIALSFTKAGRKPNEMRRGDIVRITTLMPLMGTLKVGDITEITEDSTTDRRMGIEIVCFAEDRKDNTKEGR